MIKRIIKDRVVQKIIPSLGKKSNAQTIFSVVILILAIFGTVGFGIYLDGYVIHQPKEYTGVCPAPAHISNNGQKCTVSQIVAVTSGTVTSATTVQVPAGTIITQTVTTTTVTVTK